MNAMLYFEYSVWCQKSTSLQYVSCQGLALLKLSFFYIQSPFRDVVHFFGLVNKSCFCFVLVHLYKKKLAQLMIMI